MEMDGGMNDLLVNVFKYPLSEEESNPKKTTTTQKQEKWSSC